MVDVIIDGEPAYCLPDCPNYDEIWDEKELQEELNNDEDKHLLDEPSED